MIHTSQSHRQTPPLRPVFTQPVDGRVEARNGNVSAPSQGRELLAVAENAIGDRLIAGNSSGGLVSICESDKVRCVEHGGIFTAKHLSGQRYFNRLNPATISGKATAMAKIKDILERIDQARPLENGKPLSDEQISSLATGKPKGQLIRNWRRAVKEGKDASARLDSVSAIATVIGVSTEWLMEGTGDSLPQDSEIERALMNALSHLPATQRIAAAKAALATVRAIASASEVEPEA